MGLEYYIPWDTQLGNELESSTTTTPTYYYNTESSDNDSIIPMDKRIVEEVDFFRFLLED